MGGTPFLNHNRCMTLDRRDFLKCGAALPFVFGSLKGAPMTINEPKYLALHRSGELRKRAAALAEHLSACRLCPRECRADRRHGQKGRCNAPDRVRISSAFPHFGEEEPLVGRGGSGTIFFSHCGLLCIYCQNWEISHAGSGHLISNRELAAVMMRLQQQGCANINLVTPTHFLPGIVTAIDLAAGRGLKLPMVYNTGGYEKVDVLRLLDGVIDIYMPDYKYNDAEIAAKYSPGAADYPQKARAALLEMHRQVGKLKINAGLAVSGLLVRHLVLPGGLAGTPGFVRFVAEKLGKDTYVNIMAQYRPCHQANQYPDINRGITTKEFRTAMDAARAAGLHNFL